MIRKGIVSNPSLHSVDKDVVGFVGNVEGHQTQVGEIPNDL